MSICAPPGAYDLSENKSERLSNGNSLSECKNCGLLSSFSGGSASLFVALVSQV
jgi:hypothetical protein